MPGLRSALSPSLQIGDDPVTEAGLVARAKHDPQAFALLYRRYVDRVYEYCSYRLGSREAAEDATSRTFEKVLANLPHCRDDAFRGWLFTIAAHVVADHFRATRHHEPLDAALDHPDAGPTPEETAEQTDNADHLKDLLQRLPADQRRVLELRLAGLTGAEIAAALDRSHAAVRMLQLRAVSRLRVLMTGGTTEGTRDGGR